MSSPARVLALLGLFTEEQPVWHTDEMNEALGYARATGYRYVRELVEAGFLQKVAAGRYALGPRIIELDYRLRRSDPVLLAAAPVMDDLVRRTRLDCVLSAMYGAKVVDTCRVSGDAALELGYGRGRPRPLFQGAAPKVILSCLARPQLVRVHAQHAAEIAARGLGADWAAFRVGLARIRRDGFYLSLGELEPSVGGAAVPLLSTDGDVLAALTLVGTCERLQTVGAPRLKVLLQKAAVQIRERLA
jgi:DNA-binding IclR family transcriptional regulator